jgi:hypothetical protein
MQAHILFQFLLILLSVTKLLGKKSDSNSSKCRLYLEAQGDCVDTDHNCADWVATNRVSVWVNNFGY